MEYQRIGLKPPDSVIEATKNYLDAQDVFADWLTTDCELGQDHWHPKMLLYKSWKRYAEEAGGRPGQLKDFAERMENAGFHEGKSNSQGRYWAGLELRPRNVDA